MPDAIYVLYLSRELQLTPGQVATLFVTSGGSAGVVGALVWPRVARRLGVGPSLIVADTLSVLGTLCVPFVSGWPEQVVVLLGGVSLTIGFAMPMVFVGGGTLRQAFSPPELIGRVSARTTYVLIGVVPLGALLGGFSARRSARAARCWWPVWASCYPTVAATFAGALVTDSCLSPYVRPQARSLDRLLALASLDELAYPGWRQYLAAKRGVRMQEIGLADAIAALRDEFALAIAQGADSDVQFPVGQVTLEFQVGVTKSGEGKAGIRFWVVEMGASGAYAAESIQKVTVELESPVDRLGRPIKVAADAQEKPG